MLNSGEVPNLFGVDEKADICEKMRVIDRQKDKSQQVCYVWISFLVAFQFISNVLYSYDSGISAVVWTLENVC